MTDDVVSKVKEDLAEGGNWPYRPGSHSFAQNPFAPRWPGPEVFAGHEDELTKLRENIQRHANTFITGPFGVGKTILAKTMYHILLDVDGYHPIWVDVQGGRFSKAMAEEILRELDADFSSDAKENALYNDIVDEFRSMYEQGIQTVIFYDEVINGSEGTLRSILHLQRDVESWEPVLVFNGTTNMRDQIESTIQPLSDRISERIHLEGFDIEDTSNFVYKRLRYFCEESDWNNEGCSHDTGSIEPFNRDVLDLILHDVTRYPRHLRDELNALMEKAAREKLDRIDLDLAEETVTETALEKLENQSGESLQILDLLIEEGSLSINKISEHLGISAYNVREDIDTLSREGLIRPTSSTRRGIAYKATDQAEKGLENLREA